MVFDLGPSTDSNTLTYLQLSLPSILQHEAAIDELLERWFQKLQLKHGRGETCDLAMWINLLPPDIGSLILWSEPVGLIEKGEVIANLVYGVATFQAAALVAFILPWIPNSFSGLGLDSLMKWQLKYVKSMSFIIEVSRTSQQYTIRFPLLTRSSLLKAWYLRNWMAKMQNVSKTSCRS